MPGASPEESEELCYLKAFVYFNAGRFQDAVRCIQAFVEEAEPMRSLSPKTFNIYANSLSFLGNKSEAEFSFASALSLSQEHHQQIMHTYNRSLHDLRNGSFESSSKLLETIHRTLQIEKTNEMDSEDHVQHASSKRFKFSIQYDTPSASLPHCLKDLQEEVINQVLCDVNTVNHNWNAILDLTKAKIDMNLVGYSNMPAIVSLKCDQELLEKRCHALIHTERWDECCQVHSLCYDVLVNYLL
jgi:tetratricopeptide (TPR) repeat protein